MNGPQIVAVCRSERRMTRKQSVGWGRLLESWGLEGDAHAGKWHRQVSFLAEESITRARARWNLDVTSGDFAENFTTRGIDLPALPVGTRLRIGAEAVVEITQIGKKCHTGCEIMKLTGNCIFPMEGIFGRVIRSGAVRAGDSIEVLGVGAALACTTTAGPGA